MKRLMYIVLLLMLTGSVKATVTAWRFFTEEHVEIILCHNQYGFQLENEFYFTGLAKMLNGYVGHLKQQGKLEDRMVIIEADHGDYASCNFQKGAEMWRGTDQYYFHIWDKVITLEILVQAMNYFAHDDWESFIYPQGKLSDATALKIFKARMDKVVGKPDMGWFKGKEIVVYEAGDFKAKFKNGKVLRYMKGKLLNTELHYPAPWTMKNRVIIATDEHFRVYENGSLILKYSMFPHVDLKVNPNYYFGLYDYRWSVKAYSQWANITSSHYSKFRFSYSHTQNKFYRVKRRE